LRWRGSPKGHKKTSAAEKKGDYLQNLRSWYRHEADRFAKRGPKTESTSKGKKKKGGGENRVNFEKVSWSRPILAGPCNDLVTVELERRGKAQYRKLPKILRLGPAST